MKRPIIGCTPSVGRNSGVTTALNCRVGRSVFRLTAPGENAPTLLNVVL